MAKKLIVANWKMNSSFDEADQWFIDFLEKQKNDKNVVEKVGVIVCPPVVLIDNMSANMMDYSFEKIEASLFEQNKKAEDLKEQELSAMILSEKPLSLGAQDCHFENSGAFTGDVSAKMIADVGAEYVIVGHSERRAGHYEGDEIVAKKIKALASEELTPILCVGESKEVRDEGKHLEFVYRQLLNSVPKDVKFKKFVIAYEPIWSIGTGVVPTASQIQEMAGLIRKICKEKIAEIAGEFFVLYGGSASLENAQEILSTKNVDGLLIGKVSLNAGDFFEICKIAAKV